MNFLHIAGHLGADPEVRFTSSGLKVTTLRVATKTRKKGEDRTIWWKVTVWGEQFDKMIAHFKKGSSLMAFGELDEPTIFNDRQGVPQISMSMTATQLMFSPFGKEQKGQEHSGKPASLKADSTVASLENAFDSAHKGGFSQDESKSSNDHFFSGFGSGLSSENNSYPSDEEIPF